jgi:hypothetical protein
VQKFLLACYISFLHAVCFDSEIVLALWLADQCVALPVDVVTKISI